MFTSERLGDTDGEKVRRGREKNRERRSQRHRERRKRKEGTDRWGERTRQKLRQC